MLRMWDVGDVGCWRCEMLGIMGCWECEMLGIMGC